MGTTFRPGWDSYVRHYSQNQAYLDCFSENQVLSAMGKAYMGQWASGQAAAMLKAACDIGGTNVDVEQGPHQPEDMTRFGGDGFCLHVTARYQGRAFHLYVQQDKNGGLEVIHITV
jgi:hypothetical protein